MMNNKVIEFVFRGREGFYWNLFEKKNLRENGNNYFCFNCFIV